MREVPISSRTKRRMSRGASRITVEPEACPTVAYGIRVEGLKHRGIRIQTSRAD